MDRLVISSISGHLPAGNWTGEQVFENKYEYLTSCVDWRRHLSLFLGSGPGYSFMTKECVTFSSAVHYMEFKRHELIATLEQTPRSTSSCFSTPQYLRGMIMQSCRLIPPTYLQEKWLEVRDQHLQTALTYTYQQNGALRDVLLNTYPAELWIGPELISDDDVLRLFFDKTDNEYTRFTVLETVRLKLRQQIMNTSDFCTAMKASVIHTYRRKRPLSALEDCQLEYVISLPQLKEYISSRSFTDLIADVNALQLKEQSDLAHWIIEVAADIYFINKDWKHLRLS